MSKMAKIACKKYCVAVVVCHIVNAHRVCDNNTAGLKRGAFFITLTKRLPSTDFEVVDAEMYKMSWGEATIFVLQKITEPYSDPNESDDDDDDAK